MMVFFLWALLSMASDDVLREPDVVPNLLREEPSTTSENTGSFDVQYATNGPVAQGFLIPNLFVGTHGRLSDNTEYTIAVGQTRDLASVQLPFLLPREISLQFSKLGENTSLTVGLFRPWLNPRWSLRLKEFPDYFGVHSAMLMSEQVGVELGHQLETFEVGTGLTNGNGLFALNTNNARAFHAYVRRQSLDMDWGLSGYSFRQSSPGGPNYRENWTINAYLDFRWEALSVRAGAEWILGAFFDFDSAIYSQGWATYLFLPFLGGELLIRAEGMGASPLLDGKHFKQFQIGPVFKPTEKTTLFLIEQYTEPGVTAGEVTTFARLRMELP